MIYRPLYVEKILPYIDAPFIKVLSGVRRSGKSTIMKMIAEEIKKRGVPSQNIIEYNLDSLQYEDIKDAKRFYEEVKSRITPNGKTYIFLDEIQEVNDWEKAVNSFMTDFNADIYVTGSNSRMLSHEISTYLTGRYISFRIYPLSFAEYLMFNKTEASHEAFFRFLRFGGFPAIHLREYKQDEAYAIVRDIYHSIIFTDIVKRSQIRKTDQLERIVRFVFDNVGRTFSAASIAKYLKNERRTIDNETVYDYLAKLENAFIIHRCSRYDITGKELLKTQEKFYVSDAALRYSVLGYSPDSIAAMLENIVYLELLRRGYDVYIGKVGNAEIDFVAAKQGNKIYIQIAQRIEHAETPEREYGRLLNIADNYPKYVLRTDAFACGNHKGIKTMHAADFLLSKEY
ncbi:MAG: ATP-binding protein [Defluviitaleaceae bacterium]|nr:ATP-binding protein [Defluviitaleaceae bacterium]